MPTIAPGAKVLVTGANGFLAVHVVETFLKHGYSVRGTIRSQGKGVHLHKLFSSYGDKFETVIVKDITQVGNFVICHISWFHRFHRRVLSMTQSKASMLSLTLPLHSVLTLVTPTVGRFGHLHELEGDVPPRAHCPCHQRHEGYPQKRPQEVRTIIPPSPWLMIVLAPPLNASLFYPPLLPFPMSQIPETSTRKKTGTMSPSMQWKDSGKVPQVAKSILPQRRWQKKVSAVPVVTNVVPVAKSRLFSAAWDWYSDNKGSVRWDLTTINPPYVSLGGLTPTVPTDRSFSRRYLA